MRRLRQDERGAAAVYALIVLVFFGIGTAALVVDLGDVFWERRMQQNSADAAALAVAIDCAQGDCGDYETVANRYATENNRRGAYVESVTGPGGATPTFAGGQVTVVTRTGSTAAPGRLTQFFSGILGREQGLEAAARATAIWGVPPLIEQASNLTVSICAFTALTGLEWSENVNVSSLPTVSEAADLVANGNMGGIVTYASGPQQGNFEGDTCQAPPFFYTNPDDGSDELPATFGWLDSSDCFVSVSTDSDGTWADTKPGQAAGGETACIKDLVDEDPPVAVFPIFVGIREDENGTPQEYRIVAPAAFYITGYRLPGAGGNGINYPQQGQPVCSQNERCIRGHFVQLIVDSNPIDDITFGLTSVRLSE